MRLPFLWLALVCLSLAQDNEVTTPLTTPTATEVSAQAKADESISEDETTTEGEEENEATTEIIEAVTESLIEETTDDPGEEDTTVGGEVVIEAEEEEDEVDEEEEAFVVKSASYTMSTDATLGLEIDIVLEHLSNDKVRMVCEMEEKEATTEEVDPASDESETTSTPASEETAEVGATEAPEGESEDTTEIAETVTEAVTESFRASITGGTIYLLADTVACNDLTTAIAEGYTVEALPLADVTGVGDAIGFLDVEWADIKKGSCLAILKEAADATTLAAEEETTTEAAEEETTDVPRRRKKRMFSSNVLRTEGLPRVFTAINLATFSVLSVGVTGAFAVAAVVSQASSSSSSSSSSSTSGSSITLWSANEQLIYGTLGVLGLFAAAYYFSRRDLFRQRMASFSQRLSQIAPISPVRARIADRLDAFEDGMVDVLQRLGQGIHWRNGQSRVANIASFASRVGSAVVEPYINYYKNLLPSTKYRRNLGSKIRRIDEWLKDTFNSDPGVYEAYPGSNEAYW